MVMYLSIRVYKLEQIISFRFEMSYNKELWYESWNSNIGSYEISSR